MQKHGFNALGTRWAITIWDALPETLVASYMRAGEAYAQTFEEQYSRFVPTSLVSTIATQLGVVEVPRDLTAMLRLYSAVSVPTRGKITPTIGSTLADLGYDAEYSFQKKPVVRKAPPIEDALTILDDTHIKLHTPTQLDLGAVGKGYLVDRIFEMLHEKGVQRFLVDGSGDIRYTATPAEQIVCALEHPTDTSCAIGTLSLTEGALCASAINRRAWGTDKNHYVDPDTGASPTAVLATWVTSSTAAVADLLASALFFVEPDALCSFSFEYLVVNRALQRKSSTGFTAELFS
jgi:thiamine biosynthesis lipoprotein